ncbi:LysR substrate-binding domain-containing protein [Sphingobium sp. MK2]|uniref:LysR family transcriptional regulator n=1 Tax=Sphingobium sp. MK2 TaxID=3116540 RepID=UPI0032E35DB5
MLTLSQCRILSELALHGSLNRAAAVLQSSPPVLSRKLAAIEKAVGSPLFQRTGRGLELSDLGERMLPQVERILHEAAQLEWVLGDVASVRGVVRIGLLPAGFNLMLSRLLRDVQSQHPGIQLLISDGSSGAMEEALDAGRLDLAFITRVNAKSGENERLLTQNAIELYIPECIDVPTTDGEVAFSDLAQLPLIVPQAPNTLRTALRQASVDRGIKLDLRYEINAFGFQLHLLRQGFGCYIGARGTVPQYGEDGDFAIRAARIVDPCFSGSIVLAHSKHHPLTRAARTVMEHALRIARDLRGLGVWKGF